MKEEYFNIPYRFSTFPIDLKSTDGGVVQYSGMLGDPNISQRTRITGFDIEAETVSFEVVFPFNVVNDWMIDCVIYRVSEISVS